MTRQSDPHAAPHARAAVREVLATLAEKGIKCSSVDQAIQQGHITNLDWCDVLDRHREAAATQTRLGISISQSVNPAEYQQEWRKKRKGGSRANQT